MPPACSDRWKYFTKGSHPNPPISDGRTGGAPHTALHPCSNPKVFWVQCNFCIKRNGGNFLDDDKAWIKSREEQMMQHLKTCCQESRQAWEEIMDWKYQKKVASGRVPNKKRAAPIAALRRGQMDPPKNEGGTTKKARTGNNSASWKSELGAAASPGQLGVVNASSASLSTTRTSSAAEQHKLNPTQLRHFHKVCTVAVASRGLDFTFFEDPIIMELFNVLRSGIVAGGQLPSQQLLAGVKKDGSENYFEKFASEQVVNDMVKIIRTLKRYEGLKTSVLCNLSKEASSITKAPPASFLCGGEVSCLVVPEMQKKPPACTFGGSPIAQGLHPDSYEDGALALAAKIEAQFWTMGDILGRTMQRDEEGLLKPGGNVRQSNNNVEDTHQDSEDEIKSRQSMGLSYIGSCLLARYSRGTAAEYSTASVSRAQRILANRWPMIFFTSTGCFSEQLNLLLKDFLTKIPGSDFLEPVEHAFNTIRVLQGLQSTASSSSTAKKWVENFEKVILDVYFGGETEKSSMVKDLLRCDSELYFSSWTPTQQRLAFLLRIRTGCYTFATQYSMESDFPDECRIFTARDFWDNMEKAEALIRPLSRVALKYIPEKDMTMKPTSSKDEENATISTTMADVVYAFYFLYRAWSKPGFPEVVQLLEKRWRRYECPWLLLAFIFHPAYTEEAKAFLKKQTKEDGLFSAKYLSNAILGYTIKYLASELTGDTPLSIPVLKRQATAYMDRLERGEVDNAATMQMKKDWKEYWSFQSSTPELAKFVLFLLSTSVQSNSVDEMFRDLAAQYVQVDTVTDSGPHRGNALRAKFKEQLEILEKAGRPYIHKWRSTGTSKHGGTNSLGRTHQVVNPAERPQASMDPSDSRLPSMTALPTITTPTAETKKGTNKSTTPERERLYDPEAHARVAFEEEIVSKLSSMNGDKEQIHSNPNMTITSFWSGALAKLGEEDDDEFEDAVMEEHDYDDYEEPAASSSHDDDGADESIPQFTLPAYAKPASSGSKARKIRRTYRPEQVDFDFMKHWTDTRDQPLLPNSSPEMEIVSQLKNYRANKIKLADFFASDNVPESFQEWATSFDDFDGTSKGTEK